MDITSDNIDSQIDKLEDVREQFRKLGADDNVATLTRVIDSLESERDVFNTLASINNNITQLNKYTVDGNNQDNVIQLLEDTVQLCEGIEGKSVVEDTNTEIKSVKSTCSDYLAELESINNSDVLIMTEEDEKTLSKIESTLDELGIAYE
ncbi:hypothetical protein K4T26_12370 [Staphylococcus epidermidis]|nr:hypothetical protein [Staphylococcus epidermidis]